MNINYVQKWGYRGTKHVWNRINYHFHIEIIQECLDDYGINMNLIDYDRLIDAIPSNLMEYKENIDFMTLISLAPSLGHQKSLKICKYVCNPNHPLAKSTNTHGIECVIVEIEKLKLRIWT